MSKPFKLKDVTFGVFFLLNVMLYIYNPLFQFENVRTNGDLVIFLKQKLTHTPK